MPSRMSERLAARGCWKLARLLVAVVGLLALWSTSASAQTITIGTVGRIRPVPGEERPDPRRYDYRNTRPWWINYQDCIANEVFVFPITVNNARATVEVWAGNDTCDEKRGNADRGQCWLVASETARRDMTIDVPVRTVVEQDRADLTISTGLGPEVCETSTDEDGQQLTFFFFIEDGGRAVSGSVQRWTGGAQGTGFDLVGPNPPAGIDVSTGEDQLTVSFGNLEEDLQLERIGAYCVPAGTIADVEPTDVFEPAGDAGAPVVAPGAADAGTAAARCEQNLLVQGQRPNFEAALREGISLECGRANKSAGEVRTRGLTNGQLYAVGVAGEDLLNNPGVLSQIRCAAPEEVEDFFERYKFQGGLGGGGFCTMSFAARSSAPAGVALLGLLLVALRVRRVRSRS